MSSNLHHDAQLYGRGKIQNPIKKIYFQAIILIIISFVACSVRLFSILRFESIIHEFDPWFNYRVTERLVEKGYSQFIDWFDETAWYPLGRNVGATLFPGIMITAGMMHTLVNRFLNIAVSIKDVCVMTGPIFSIFTVIATYFLTSEVDGSTSGLIAAALVAIVPGYLSRSVAGSYDNEAISITLMMATFAAWLRALRIGTIRSALPCAALYYYMASAWGGYVYISNLIPLHTALLLTLNRFTHKIYTAYSSFYIIGTTAIMTVPFIGMAPAKSSEHLAGFGVFGLIQIYAIFKSVDRLTNKQFPKARKTILFSFAAAIMVMISIILLLVSGHVTPWTGRFRSLWNSDYAKIKNPIVASVSEHQPTTWASFFFDMGILMGFAPAGLIRCMRRRKDGDIFLGIFAITASYFSAAMIRLILTLAPVMCVLGGISFSNLISSTGRKKDTSTNDDEHEPLCQDISKIDSKNFTSSLSPENSLADDRVCEKISAQSKLNTKDVSAPEIKRDDSYFSKFMIKAIVILILGVQSLHCIYVAKVSYSSPSIILTSVDPNTGKIMLMDDFRDAYSWIRQNTAPDAKILSWWDYGYQIAGMANRTTIVDNNTWNTTHIALTGLALSLPEKKAYPIMRKLGAEYVLVLCGALASFTGDDMSKMYWITRIAAHEFPDQINSRDYLSKNGQFSIDPSLITQPLMDSVLYRAVFGGDLGKLTPNDRVRRVKIPEKNSIPLHSLVEVYSSALQIVRIYKLRDPDPLGRSFFPQ